MGGIASSRHEPRTCQGVDVHGAKLSMGWLANSTSSIGRSGSASGKLAEEPATATSVASARSWPRHCAPGTAWGELRQGWEPRSAWQNRPAGRAARWARAHAAPVAGGTLSSLAWSCRATPRARSRARRLPRLPRTAEPAAVEWRGGRGDTSCSAPLAWSRPAAHRTQIRAQAQWLKRTSHQRGARLPPMSTRLRSARPNGPDDLVFR